MRTPQVFSATEIKNWHIEEEYEKGKWRLARPCGFIGNIRYFKVRFRIAWRVFTGRYDALNWQNTGVKKNEDTNYRDIIDPDFGSTKHT